MIEPRSRRTLDLGSDRGITLVELLVAVTLLGVFLTLISGLYVSAMKTVSLGRELTGNTKQVSTAMLETSRVIRAATENPLPSGSINAPAFVIAKTNDVMLYAYINLASSLEQPVMIRLRVDTTTGNYMESRWPATALTGGKWSFPSNPCESPSVPSGCTAPATYRTIASTIAPYVSGDPVFRYLQADGTCVPVSSTNSTCATDLTEAQRRLVASVRVTLTTQTSLTNNKNPVTVVNTVGIPNLGFPTIGT